VKPLDVLKLSFLAAGVIVWAFGFRTERQSWMYVGMGFVVVAFILRFVRPGGQPRR